MGPSCSPHPLPKLNLSLRLRERGRGREGKKRTERRRESTNMGRQRRERRPEYLPTNRGHKMSQDCYWEMIPLANLALNWEQRQQNHPCVPTELFTQVSHTARANTLFTDSSLHANTLEYIMLTLAYMLTLCWESLGSMETLCCVTKVSC